MSLHPTYILQEEEGDPKGGLDGATQRHARHA
jgi:hypothetical protein